MLADEDSLNPERPTPEPGENGAAQADQPVEMPIDGTLDLHMFPPREVKDLVRDYLEACLQEGILDLRIVHGKGIGNLRRIVHSILDGHPAVDWYGHQSDGGSWGATVVRLRSPEYEDEE